MKTILGLFTAFILMLVLAFPAEAAIKGTKYTNTVDGYTITIPSGWYRHATDGSMVFTTKKKQVIPAMTDGYALAPVWTIDVQTLSDGNGKSISKTEWLKLNVGTVDANGQPMKTRLVNINGRRMIEVVGNAAGATGKQVSYFAFTKSKVYHAFQYPYRPGSAATTAVQQALGTMKFVK